MIRSEKNHSNRPNNLKVVTVEYDQNSVEREIERHVKVIRSLINKLAPVDKQKYFNGLLSHIINDPGQRPKNNSWNQSAQFIQSDFSKLSVRELSLLEELSEKMEEMYRVSNDNLFQ